MTSHNKHASSDSINYGTETVCCRYPPTTPTTQSTAILASASRQHPPEHDTAVICQRRLRCPSPHRTASCYALPVSYSETKYSSLPFYSIFKCYLWYLAFRHLPDHMTFSFFSRRRQLKLNGNLCFGRIDHRFDSTISS